MSHPVATESLDVLFASARTFSAWQKKPVAPEILQKIYDQCKFGPTSANCSPLRIVFVSSDAARQKLKPCLDAGNVDKTMSAPVTAIFASDQQFYDLLPRLFPHADARSWFFGNSTLIADTAFRNSSLQAAYFMIAARGMGLDCGPMSGFDKAKCDAAFFPDGRFKSNFLCNLGYGDAATLKPRLPRLDFNQACRIE